MRRPLQKLLYEAWTHVIENDYANRRVNSERSLQAAFWSQLNERLPTTTCRLFVEPRFDVAGYKPVYPDLVITNIRSIIAVIELKYQPRVSPAFGKDMRSLDALARGRAELSLCHDRYLGNTSAPRPFSFAKDVLFVWAGVYRLPPGVDPPAFLVTPALAGSFYAMHATTDTGIDAVLRTESA